MGDYDVVKAVLGRIAEMQWMQVAIKPAKPFAFGLVDGGGGDACRCSGCPATRCSSLVSFELFARPALRRMMGHHRARPAVRRWRSPTPTCAAGPTARSTSCGSSAAFGDDGRVHVVPVGRPGQPPARGHRARPTPSSCSPDGDGVAAGDEVGRPAPRLADAGVSRDVADAATLDRPFGRVRRATCASRSPTAATSAARTACPRRA